MILVSTLASYHLTDYRYQHTVRQSGQRHTTLLRQHWSQSSRHLRRQLHPSRPINPSSLPRSSIEHLTAHGRATDYNYRGIAIP
jgi:hypothetical protein